MAAALQLEGVGRRFPDGTQALDGVSLQVERGEFVCLVGASGCGKSTLLRIAAGLDQPTAGQVHADRSGIGFVFQEPALLPWRSVRGNVELAAELRGVEPAERRARADDALRRVGLQDFAEHLPRQLSGGMKMRASLARALVLRPSLFLFDEPFGALDEITREALQQETLTLFARERFAGVLVTHSVREAVFLGTRVVVLSPRPGRVAATFEIDLPPVRDRALQFSPAFTALAAAVSDALTRATEGA